MAITKNSLRRILALCERREPLHRLVQNAFDVLSEEDLSVDALRALMEVVRENQANPILHSILSLLIKWPENIEHVQWCFSTFEELNPKFTTEELISIFTLFKEWEFFSEKLVRALLILKTDLELFTPQNVRALIARREEVSVISTPASFSLLTSNITYAGDLARAFVLLVSIDKTENARIASLDDASRASNKLAAYRVGFLKNPMGARRLAECVYNLYQLSPDLYWAPSFLENKSAEEIQNVLDFVQYPIEIQTKLDFVQYQKTATRAQPPTKDRINSLKDFLWHVPITKKLLEFCELLPIANLLNWQSIDQLIFYRTRMYWYSSPSASNLLEHAVLEAARLLQSENLLNQEKLNLLLNIGSRLSLSPHDSDFYAEELVAAAGAGAGSQSQINSAAGSVKAINARGIEILTEYVNTLYQLAPSLCQNLDFLQKERKSLQEIKELIAFMRYVAMAKSTSAEPITEDGINALKEFCWQIPAKELIKLCALLQEAGLLSWDNMTKLIDYKTKMWRHYSSSHYLFRIDLVLLNMTRSLHEKGLLNQARLELLLKETANHFLACELTPSVMQSNINPEASFDIILHKVLLNHAQQPVAMLQSAESSVAAGAGMWKRRASQSAYEATQADQVTAATTANEDAAKAETGAGLKGTSRN